MASRPTPLQAPRRSSARGASVAVRAAVVGGGVRAQTAAEGDAKPPRRRGKCRVTVDVTACRYAIIRRCLRERDFRLVKKTTSGDGTGALLPAKWDIWWSDRGDLLRELPRLSPFQKVNHFPSMEEICRKDFLANNLNAIYKVIPSDFDFFPRSFLVPAESVELQKAMENAPKNATYIVKPRTLCQGKGISLIQSFSKLPQNEPCVVQRYIDNPLLIDGLKFDLRIYVLVYSVNPLKIFIFKNGLARFCTTPFQTPTWKNINKKRMHLTNYAINKRSRDFQQAKNGSDTQASKRSVASVLQGLEETGRCSSSNVWSQINDIVIKTLLCIEPKLQASYKSYFGSNEADEALWGPKCFEILGFDIMLDANGKAWLFEVNHAPSFAGDSPLDREIKTALISGTLDIVGVTNKKKLKYVKQQRSEWTKRLWSSQVQTGKKEATGTSGNNNADKEPVDVVKPGGKEQDPAADSESEVEQDGHGDESDKKESDNDHTDVEEDEDPEGMAHHEKTRLSNVLFKRNRVVPAPEPVAASAATTPSVSNEFVLLFPVEQNAHPLWQCYDRVREAAQVNRSKLWS